MHGLPAIAVKRLQWPSEEPAAGVLHRLSGRDQLLQLNGSLFHRCLAC